MHDPSGKEKQENRRAALRCAQAITLVRLSEGDEVDDEEVVEAAEKFRAFLDG